MRMLGEMAAANPETGSFSTYADKALGRWAGFSIGWLYAWFWIIVLGIEATAGAAIMHRWVPGIDQWVWALVLMVLLTLTNLGSVKSYGEFEFWFASIKVAAIVLFLLFGAAAILGLIPGVPAPGLDNLTGKGGFMPNGPGAVLAGILVVVFSFFGAEIATIAAGESENPVDAVKKAVKSTVWRILVFYIGSIAIVVTLLPWNCRLRGQEPVRRRDRTLRHPRRRHHHGRRGADLRAVLPQLRACTPPAACSSRSPAAATRPAPGCGSPSAASRPPPCWPRPWSASSPWA